MKSTMLASALSLSAAFVGAAFGAESLQDVMKRRQPERKGCACRRQDLYADRRP